MRLVERIESYHAMGGSVQIGLITPESFYTTPLLNNLLLMLFEFERSASRFIESSELTQLNKHAATKQEISPIFKDVLLAAANCANMTDGLYNPFVLPAVQRTGYLASVASPDKSIVHDVRMLRVTSHDKLEVGSDWARIPYGSAIDLGGCGKGYIVDKLAAAAKLQGVRGGWIEASGDIYAWGRDANGDNLRIAIQDQNDVRNQSYTVIVPPKGCGIATSGTFTRPGIPRKPGSHHIIDPRTGKPAQTDLSLATVVAESALVADVLASCALIVGSKDAPAFLNERGANNWLLQFDKRLGLRGPVTAGPDIIEVKLEMQHA